MSESIPDPNLRLVESALRGLLPASPAIARDRLLFEAGRRSVRRGAWPIATAAFAALSLFLGWRLLDRPDAAPQMALAPAPALPVSIAPDSVVRLDPHEVAPRSNMVELLLLGAPDYLPGQPNHAREIEQWLQGGPANVSVIGGTVPPRESLGLPPGTLGNPVRPQSQFGPIRRGDA
jgi:hypothetical protein